MALTAEEIAQLQSAEDYTQHELVKPLLEAGFTIRTTTHYQEALDNYATDKIKSNDRNAYTLVEQEVLDATGVEKQPNEKATDYMKRAYGVTKDKVTQYETELTALKEKQNDGDATKADKARITQLTELLNQQKSEYEGKLSEALTAAKKATQKGIINANMSAISAKLNKSVDSAIMQAAAAHRLTQFEAEHTVTFNENGEQVVLDKTGKEMLDTAGTFKPLTPMQVMETYFADLLHKEQPGAGAGGTGSTQGTGSLAIPAEIKSMVQLTTYLKQKGIAAGSEEYGKFYKEYQDKLPLK